MRRIDPRVASRRPELSQHYLRGAAARSIARRLRAGPGALVLEPGAGDGALTAALADAGYRVIAIEKDVRLYQRLRARFAASERVECVHADVLDMRLPSTPYCVVSNVPYGITAALMRKLLHAAARAPDIALLILQREAAEKFAGAAQETLFSLLHKPWFDIHIECAISRHDFVPPPRVQSALLRIERRAVPLVRGREAARYRLLTECAFTYGLQRALRQELTSRQIKRLAHDLGFTAESRVSQLNRDQWLSVFRFVEHECLGHDPTTVEARSERRENENATNDRATLQQVLLRRAGWLATEVVDQPALEAV